MSEESAEHSVAAPVRLVANRIRSWNFMFFDLTSSTIRFVKSFYLTKLVYLPREEGAFDE